MDKPVVRYRILVTLVTFAVVAAVVFGNHHLPSAYQIPAWGVAIGVLTTFSYIVLTWVFPLSSLWLVLAIPIVSGAWRYVLGFGFGYPRGNYYWLGEGIGIVVMIAIVFASPLRPRFKASPLRRRPMPPMEEASSHKLILPKAPEPRSGKPHPR